MNENTKASDCCAAREMTNEELLRAKARSLHEEAVQLEQLADHMEYFRGGAAITLRNLILKGLR